jgi:hypothetical protein
MGRTTIEVDERVRDELRSFKADRGATYDEAIIQLLFSDGWEFRHFEGEGSDELMEAWVGRL